MIEDAELLRRYVDEKSDAAFAELVNRHLRFVYACALRRVGGDAHLAQDVTQTVFTALARRAATLKQREVLSGWLYTTARNASAQWVRTARRRQVREQEAHAMNEITPATDHSSAWERMRLVLDDALDQLSEDDRQAVLLRFFEGQSFSAIGAKLQLAENTARMRVERALDKLQGLLARRGVTSTSAALALALANQPVIALPTGLAATITGAALIQAGTAGAVAAATLTFMTASKLVAGFTSVAAIVAIGIGISQHTRLTEADHALTRMREERDALAAQLARAQERRPRDEPQPREAVPPPTANVVAPSSPAPLPAPPLSPAAPVTPTLEATKLTLARIGPLRAGEGTLEPQHIANVRSWAKQDPEGVVRWLGTVPSAGKQREHSVEAVIASVTETDPELAFLLANSLERELPRLNRLSEVVRAWAPRDPAAATRAISSADVSDANRERLTRQIERAKKAQP